MDVNSTGKAPLFGFGFPLVAPNDPDRAMLLSPRVELHLRDWLRYSNSADNDNPLLIITHPPPPSQ